MSTRNRGAGLPEVVCRLVSITNFLRGQKALVTGASSGISKGIAAALAEAGADVVVNYGHNQSAANQVVQDICRCGNQAYAHYADVSGEGQVIEMFQQMIKQFGAIDILINNAGLQKDAPFDEMTLDQWNFVIAI